MRVTGDQERFVERTRQRWNAIDWQHAIAHDAFVIPEAHYMEAPIADLTPAQRVVLNRLFACFTCELFVHFEQCLIHFLQTRADRLTFLPDALRARFIAEEQVHCEMFMRLLHKLRADLYPPTTDVMNLDALRFLRWTQADARALRLASTESFFLIAWLFEEITLFVPPALDAVPTQSDALVRAVMQLHAEEEEAHVAIDLRVIDHITRDASHWRDRAHAALAVILLAFVDARVKKAWQKLATLAAQEAKLNAAQHAQLMRRGPSQSDRWGMASFLRKVEARNFAGAGLLGAVLRP